MINRPDKPIPGFELRPAKPEDVPVILTLIKAIAEYEKLSKEVIATEENLHRYLFGKEKVAEVILGYFNETPVGYIMFFYNFSSFLARPGIYLEDLFIYEQYRGKGFGKKMLTYLAKLAVEKNCGRVEWAVIDWNEPSINFYKSIGARMMNEWILTRLAGDELIALANEY